MMRWRRDHRDRKRGDGQMSEDEEELRGEPHLRSGGEQMAGGGWSTATTGKGPTLINNRAAEKDEIT
jgi:hypothetical protein